MSEGQGLISCLPQAHHQPTLSPSEETAFSFTFYREVFEELFEGEEIKGPNSRLKHDWFFRKCEPVAWLRDHSESCPLSMLGLGFNLITGNYEAAVLQVVQDPMFWAKFGDDIRVNWEAVRPLEPMISTRHPDILAKLLAKPNWTGAGIFAFALALDRLHEMDPVRAPLAGVAC